nr:hypothetical protein [Helicobacter pylori]
MREWLEAEVIKIKHPFLKLFYPKKTELEKVLFLVFMLFLMKINKLIKERCFTPFTLALF